VGGSFMLFVVLCSAWFFCRPWRSGGCELERGVNVCSATLKRGEMRWHA
jgi:hypothetical protein